MMRRRFLQILGIASVLLLVTAWAGAEWLLTQVVRPDGVGLVVNRVDGNDVLPVQSADLFWLITPEFDGMAEPIGSASTILVVENGRVSQNFSGDNATLPPVPAAPEGGYVLVGSGIYYSFLRNLQVGASLELQEKPRALIVQNPNMIITENGDVHPITALNKGRGTDNMILYTPDFGTHTITNQWGTEVAVVDGVVVAVRQPGTTQPFPIPENGYVLSGHGSANSWLSKHAPLGTKLEVAVGSVLGMRMTDPEFFRALDLTLPGLEAVREAVEAFDWEAAKAAFAQYLRERNQPNWYFDPHDPLGDSSLDPNDLTVANDALRDRFNIYGTPVQFTDGNIDWTYNPTKEPGYPGAATDEWTWGLNRHNFWPRVGRAYHFLKDERYAEAFVRQMTHWVEHNPVPLWAQQGAGSTWRTIEAGLRMQGSWPNSFLYFLSSPSFTDEAIVTMVRSMVEHARYLMTHNTGGNWLTIEMNGLYHVGVLFPEFKEAAEWRRYAGEKMRGALVRQVYPDGAQVELTPEYHITALENFLGIADIAALNGYTLPDGYLSNLERMFAYTVYMLKPDGLLPDLNDSANANPRNVLWRGYQLFPEREDFLWVAMGRSVGTPPEATSYAFPWAGYLIQRSGWDGSARYLAFDVGPYGYGHQHEDKLNFILTAYGRDLVVDAGKHVYDDSKWRAYVRSAYGHNVAFVDGKGQNRRLSGETFVTDDPLPHIWKVTDEWEFAQGYYGNELEGYGDIPRWIATHQRSILYVKERAGRDFWVVADTFLPQDAQPHTYETLFHLNADEVSVDERGAVRTLYSHGANVGIFPLVDGAAPRVEVVKGQEEPYVQGWMYVPGRGQRAIPTAVYTVEGAGIQHLLYVLYPVAQGEVPGVEVTPWDAGLSRDTGVGAEIRFADGREYRVYFPTDASAGVEVDGTKVEDGVYFAKR